MTALRFGWTKTASFVRLNFHLSKRNVDELANKVRGVRESRAAIAAQLGVGETTFPPIVPKTATPRLLPACARPCTPQQQLVLQPLLCLLSGQGLPFL